MKHLYGRCGLLYEMYGRYGLHLYGLFVSLKEISISGLHKILRMGIEIVLLVDSNLRKFF